MAEKESTFARYITSGNTWNFLKAPEAKKHIIDCYASWDADLSELTLLKTLNINNQEAMETTSNDEYLTRSHMKTLTH